MAVPTSQINQPIRLTCSFKVGVVLTDPTTIKFFIHDPLAAATTYQYGVDSQLVRDSTGVYHVDVTPVKEGEYTWRFEGTGVCVAAEEGFFRCLKSKFS